MNEELMREVRLLIEQHRAARPGSVAQAIIGQKIVEILRRLGQWNP
jgi:hypothetical protein